tara:strand:+ start:129 stop:1472 length:1344 start_codon:yes stop_codon:yes gene_type:complete
MTTSVGRNSGSTATPTKATFSYWLKGSHDGTQQGIWGWHRGNDASNFWLGVYYSTNGSMYFNWKQTSLSVTLGTTQKFRDPTAWAHHVIAIDTTQGTAADRVKWYIDGDRVTSFEDSLDTISQNTTILNWSNSQDKMEIGTWYQASAAKNLNNHCISHFHMTDGYVYDASSFGSTDSTTGTWKINTVPNVTYGNEGGFWFKDDGALTDRSGAGNNFTLDQGTLTTTQDNPSNNFAVINYLNPNAGENIAFSSGNTSINSTGGAHRNAPASIYLPLGNGKFYWEMKVDRMSTHVKVGLVYDEWSKLNKPTPGEEHSGSNEGYAYRNDGQKENNGTSSFGNSYTVNDIIGIAFDTENRKLYYSKNGTWQNSGDPTSGSTGTGAAFTVASGYTYAPIVNLYNADVSFNFGNGFFGSTAIASEGTNASGLGKFEYDVPAGYTAICTKGLNE